VLKALGVNIELPPEKASRVLDEVGITFLFAPLLHSAMKHAAPVRKELGVRTIFNILGPLTNPAGARRQLIGVFDPSLTEKLAGVLRILGGEHVLVVHGKGGLDEFSTAGDTIVSEVKAGEILSYRIRVEELGLQKSSPDELKGGDAEMNAELIRWILKGRDGAPRNVVALNAGAALYTGGLASSIREGVAKAFEAIDSGAADTKLNEWIEASRT
jgi:anthranilate phosphoribosyltransferase